jgi:hypothetical protein
MKHPVLVKLYYDQYAGLGDVDNAALIVTDALSYAAARQSIERMKAGDIPAPLTIIVRSRRFFTGFHDLALLGNLVETRRIAPKEEIASAFHIQVPIHLTDRDLIALGIEGCADLLADAGHQGICDQTTFDDALLAKAFGSQVFRISGVTDFQGWFTDLMAFLYSEAAPARQGWAVDYVRHMAEERARLILERFDKKHLSPFFTDLLQRCATGKAKIYLNQLAVRYWLSSYSRLARKTVINHMTDQVGQWQDVNGGVAILEALSPWCEDLYRQAKNPLIERLEHLLTPLLAGGDLIEDEDLGWYMQQMSGRFAAEYEAVQMRLGRLLLEQYNAGTLRERKAALSRYLAQLDSHFAPFFQRTGQVARKASWLDTLPEFGEVISHLSEAAPSHWADWLATYELLIKARQLQRQVQDTMPSQYADKLAGLSDSFSVLDERLNSQFAEWLLSEHPKLMTSSMSQPPLAMHAARLALDSVGKGHRIIFLVVDALDWELWRHLRSAFGRQGFIVQGSEAGLAMLPTITEFSRRAIFGGISPRNLAHFVDDIYGTEISPKEEAKTLARALGYLGRVDQLKVLPNNEHIQYLADELVYANGSAKDFRQALELAAKCYAFVYTEIDTYIHGSKSEEPEVKASAAQWLSNLAEEILQGIQHNSLLRDYPHLKVIIASDHGFLDVSKQNQAMFERSLMTILDLERHGRLAIARVGNAQGITSALQALKDFYNNHSAAWHIIWREQSEHFGLAESSPSEGEVVAWLMPRSFQYVKRSRGNYVHGGLSMYEAIVPLAVLSRGVLEVEAPVVTITGRLASEEEGELSIAILNQGDRPLQNLIIDIPELGLRGLQAKDTRPGEVGKLVVPVIPPQSGDIPVQVILDAEVGGVYKHFEESRVLSVKPGRRERMRLSTRRTFDYDEL